MTKYGSFVSQVNRISIRNYPMYIAHSGLNWIVVKTWNEAIVKSNLSGKANKLADCCQRTSTAVYIHGWTYM